LEEKCAGASVDGFNMGTGQSFEKQKGFYLDSYQFGVGIFGKAFEMGMPLNKSG
jgi:hypothetical protein